MNDTKIRYGLISKVFHWGMGILIVWQFMKFFDRINDGEHWVGQTLVPWHISIGTVLLVLVALRLIWALKQRNNRPDYEGSTAMLAKAGHFLLYVGMVLMPVTGVMIMLGKGYGWKAFGMEIVARGATKNEVLAMLGNFHSLLAWCLVILVAGHAGMALLHHFVKKDGVLKRMI